MTTRKFFPCSIEDMTSGARNFLVLALISLVFLSSPPRIHAELQDIVDTKESNEVLLYQGDLVALKVYSLTRISISKIGIVDIINADVDEVLLIGRGVGETPIFIWDEYGKRTVVARVFQDDLDLTIARIESLLNFADIQGVTLRKNHFEGRVVATGKITKYKKEDLDEILKSYSWAVINMVKESEDLIHIDVQISELSTTLTKELGFDWTAGGSTSVALTYPETLPTQDGSLRDLFKIGDFSRTSALLATVSALIQEGKARILSKPSVVVSNGEDATFLVGGEIPIRTTTTSTGGTSVQENITFKSYGIDLSVTPEIKDGKIDVTLSVAIRDIDAANAVGNDVAFTTRTAQTRLILADGQTTVIAGLIKKNENETLKGIPFLSKLPIVGALFRKRFTPTPNQDQEIVISLTMRIIKGEKVDEEEETLAAYKEEKEGTVWTEETTLDQEEDAIVSWDKEISEELGLEMEDTEPGIDESFDWETEVFEEEFKEEETIEALAGDEEEMAIPLGTIDLLETIDAQAEAMEIEAEGGLQEEDISGAVTAYAQSIQQKISQFISFPYEAKQRGWEGKVTLTLVVLSDGSLNDVSIKGSSGHDVFDNDAVNTTQILAPFDSFPAELSLEELILMIPIVYSQEAVLGAGDDRL